MAGAEPARRDASVVRDSGKKPVSKPVHQRIHERAVAPVGYSLAAIAVATGWVYRDSRPINAEEGLGYALGIVAISCMIILLVYPLRKRVKMLGFLGTVRNWFRTHMLLGVLGPLAALYHCNFQLGSLNSRIALFSALLVAGSGLVGRFLYARIHHGLYGRKMNLKKERARIDLMPPAGGKAMQFLPELIRRMRSFDEEVLEPRKSIAGSVALLFRITIRTRLKYRELIRFTKRSLAAEAGRSSLVGRHERRLFKSTRRFVAGHMAQVRRVAKLQAYERLFVLWHVAHLPFFFLLIVSAVVHVFAVHLY